MSTTVYYDILNSCSPINMRKCHVFLHYTIVIIILSCSKLLDAKSLNDGSYQNDIEDRKPVLSKRAAAGYSDEESHRFVPTRQKIKRRRSPFGVVYKDGKPIGILEPISRIYEYQTFQDDLNSKNKRDNVNNDLPQSGEESYVKRDIDRLETVKSFHMNPHHDSESSMTDSNTNIDKKEHKRDAKKQYLNTVQANIPPGDTKLSVIENNLKEIISDLNTINTDEDDNEESNGDVIDKREILNEDEDLDSGANKIGLTKEIHGPNSKLQSENSIKEKKSADVMAADDKKIADYRSEGESFIRQKRQQASAAKGAADNDIIKGLEQSGDLTVSGNKSPLASASAPVEAEGGKKGKDDKDDFEKRDKQSVNDVGYEKRLQRNIQNKITEIKEQVKREIEDLDGENKKTSEKSSDSDLKKIVDHIDKPVDLNDKLEGQTRDKRNLIEQNTNELKLTNNIESESLVSHIRQKRGLENYDSNEDNNVGNTAKSDNAAQTKLNTDNKRVVRQAKIKRNSPPGFGKETNQKLAPAKLESSISHVIVTRNLKPIAGVVGGLDAEKLEKLVKESASLTESIKSERGVRFPEVGPRVDVELHGPVNRQSINLKSGQSNQELSDVALVENHSDSSDVVVNSGTNAIVMKRDASEDNTVTKRTSKQSVDKRDKTFRPSDDKDDIVKESKTKIEEIEAVQDNSPAPAQGIVDHKYKAYEASTKITPKSDDVSERSVPDSAEKIDSQRESEVKLQGGDVKNDAGKVIDEDITQKSEDGDLSKRAIGNTENNVRLERKSEPIISLEDMQALDSENNMKRRRRFVDEYDDYNPRDKRDYDLQNMHFRNYRGDEDEADDENDEFDDDNFDDRTAMRKRAAQELESNYDDLDDEYDPLGESQDDTNGNAAASTLRMNKRNVNAREYVAQMNEDANYNTNYLYDADGRPLNRNKRQILDAANTANAANIAALHGGGPMIRHLAAIKGRNAYMEAAGQNRQKKFNKKLTKTLRSSNSNKNEQMISGLSENDIFGALPQSYEGELTRFKRVKRDDPDPAG